MSLPPEIQKKVKLLEISTRKLVNNLFSGEYHSAFKGQGMTFSEFREYVPGDDVRTISWPVTARTGKPYIKKFDEERENTLMLMVDISGSSDFGGQQYFKGEALNHLAALLSFSAQRNKDPVGLMLFSDQVEHYVPPKKGKGHVHRILRDLYYFKPHSTGTKLSVALDSMIGMLKKRATVFVFSDFLDEGFERSLRYLGQKHDVTAVVVEDSIEAQLPNVGLVDVRDAETGEIMTIDTSSPVFRRDYEKLIAQKKVQRDEMLTKSRVGRVDVRCDGDIVDPLVQFFRRRVGR